MLVQNLPFKSLATATSFVFGILSVLFYYVWIDFVSLWFMVNIATIFQLNLGVIEMGKTSKFN